EALAAHVTVPSGFCGAMSKGSYLTWLPWPLRLIQSELKIRNLDESGVTNVLMSRLKQVCDKESLFC
uniref:Uncharacterized protein n=1 Tax=Xenopus tropicalis TaxID=8364 RepID=A0A6I8S3X5_XENTR